ncbi:hypothetical protein ACRRTK_022933 [Alexandromys fortis]
MLSAHCRQLMSALGHTTCRGLAESHLTVVIDSWFRDPGKHASVLQLIPTLTEVVFSLFLDQTQ